MLCSSLTCWNVAHVVHLVATRRTVWAMSVIQLYTVDTHWLEAIIAACLPQEHGVKLDVELEAQMLLLLLFLSKYKHRCYISFCHCISKGNSVNYLIKYINNEEHCNYRNISEVMSNPHITWKPIIFKKSSFFSVP